MRLPRVGSTPCGAEGTDMKEALAKDEGGSIMKRVAMNLLSREKDQ